MIDKAVIKKWRAHGRVKSSQFRSDKSRQDAVIKAIGGYSAISFLQEEAYFTASCGQINVVV